MYVVRCAEGDFLTISVVQVTGQKLSVRPSKVVAGLEAEKTNELLQALAEAVNKKVSCVIHFILVANYIPSL